MSITGTTAGDIYRVVRSGSQLLVFENVLPGGQPTYTAAISAIGPSLTINTLGGDDTLFVDSGDSADPGCGAIDLQLGAGANSLVLQRGSARIDSTAAEGTLDTNVQQGTQLTTLQLNQGGLTVGGAASATLLPGGGTAS